MRSGLVARERNCAAFRGSWLKRDQALASNEGSSADTISWSGSCALSKVNYTQSCYSTDLAGTRGSFDVTLTSIFLCTHTRFSSSNGSSLMLSLAVTVVRACAQSGRSVHGSFSDRGSPIFAPTSVVTSCRGCVLFVLTLPPYTRLVAMVDDCRAP